MSQYPNRFNRNNFNHGGYEQRFPAKMTAEWRRVEQKQCGAVVVEVSKRNMRVPQFSVRVGSSRVDENGQVLDVLPFMSIYSLDDAIKALTEIRDKYINIRENYIRENEGYMSAPHRRRDKAEYYDEDEGEEYNPNAVEGPLTAGTRRR